MDKTDSLLAQVQVATDAQQSLLIQGGNSKAFYGNPVTGETLSLQGHSGILDYDPAELVITARSGTPLKEIEHILADNNQMLAFEPPGFGDEATIGGTIACGFSGARRPYAGAARDFMLGCKLINGNAELLSFGGQVMKNVAGYDVSRLMTGALGTLGVLLEVSLKVLPVTEKEITLRKESSVDGALAMINRLAGQAFPISAASYYDGHLYVRLSGTESAVKNAEQSLGGERINDNTSFWSSINNHQHRFFKPGKPLWRVSVAADSPLLGIENDVLLDWGGAQRWIYTDADAQTIRQLVAKQGGHATCFRNAHKGVSVFHPLPAKLKQLHLNLKSAFDPRGIFNYEKVYEEI
ncbi:MAG: glycolate oxidase subunit GlcE [Gammaproteobacteria bacterium]|jgi:glycolate oxidase FAD binding subunit